MTKRPIINLYYDSGAFGAWSRSEPITVDKYADFLDRFHRVAKGYANLDVIPGAKGRVPTPAEVDEAATRGWGNYRFLVKRGLDPIPVYHRGERRYWLEKMVGEGATYIGLGGVARVRDRERVGWLDEVFAFLCGKSGWPCVKVHGFGITSIPLLHRYPWHSVDSVSWLKMAISGFVVVPQSGGFNGEPDYTLPPYTTVVGAGSKNGLVNVNTMRGDHLDRIGPSIRRYVLDYLTGEGFELKELETSRETRLRLSARFYKRSFDAFRHKPFNVSHNGLIGTSCTEGGVRPTEPFRGMLTIDGSSKDNLVLHDEGVRNRLLSFEHFLNGCPFDPADLAYTGLIRNRKQRGVV